MTTPEPINSQPCQALQIQVQGIVQGVGFRPFVYRLAGELQLFGSIANTSNGVVIELQGEKTAMREFLTTLNNAPPPISRITTVTTTEIPIRSNLNKFIILASKKGERPNTQISPDLALCEDCLQELFTPTDRRYHYPFINCTNCGPRFSIVESVPYDRPNTSMKKFPLCPKCDQEYHDPMNRRFHAQPNACPVCGPRLSWTDCRGNVLTGNDPISSCAEALKSGKIVAIKGLGGFHLAADATNTEAVHTLRQRKHRPGKPLAVMIRTVEDGKRFCRVSTLEMELLTSTRSPIVLLQKREDTKLADNLAPGIGLLGIMLPYTPLHHLLLAASSCPPALVMTSGNLSEEPICTDNLDALARLGPLADFFLLHNRDIVTRVDDSVVRVMAGKARLFRRGRGYTPEPLSLLQKTYNSLGCGAEMKSTFCLVRNNEAFLSQHIGELTSPECLDFYQESIDHLQTVLDTEIQTIGCDLHPDYLSTRYGLQQPQPCQQVQHHHAHAAAVMAEFGLDKPVLAVLFDGTGYSEDGTIYGGEWYLADRHSYTRLAHLAPLPLPGGDMAAREPWRMAMSLLHCSLGAAEINAQDLPAALNTIPAENRSLLSQMIKHSINCPLSSSCGRLFDAVAGLLGLCPVAQFEGQAAMQLEYQASLAQLEDRADLNNRYQVVLDKKHGAIVLQTKTLAQDILNDLRQGHSIPTIALSFHNWLRNGTVAIVEKLQIQTGIDTVVLAGGSMQNKILLEGISKQCEALGCTVYSGEQVPTNDGGIALGQAYIAGADAP